MELAMQTTGTTPARKVPAMDVKAQHAALKSELEAEE
jgi:hypothetical protein